MKLVNAFKKLRGSNSSNLSYKPILYLDGANGVGGKKMKMLKNKLGGLLDVSIFNLGGNGGKLNLNVRFVFFFLFKNYILSFDTFFSVVPILLKSSKKHQLEFQLN